MSIVFLLHGMFYGTSHNLIKLFTKLVEYVHFFFFKLPGTWYFLLGYNNFFIRHTSKQ